MTVEEVVDRLHSSAVSDYSDAELVDDAWSMEQDYWVSAYNLIQGAIARGTLSASEAEVVDRAARDSRFGRKLSFYMSRWLADYSPTAG